MVAGDKQGATAVTTRSPPKQKQRGDANLLFPSLLFSLSPFLLSFSLSLYLFLPSFHSFSFVFLLTSLPLNYPIFFPVLPYSRTKIHHGSPFLKFYICIYVSSLFSSLFHFSSFFLFLHSFPSNLFSYSHPYFFTSSLSFILSVILSGLLNYFLSFFVEATQKITRIFHLFCF